MQSLTMLPFGAAARAGFGGFLAIFCLAGLTAYLDRLLLIAPFGATCVLVFALPDSPLAQPRNVIGGHLISSAVGLSVLALLGPGPLALALGVGLAIGAMVLTRTLHPPAGADPIVVILAGASWPFLLAPVLVGTVFLVLLSRAYRAVWRRRTA
ncbi:HPP family protein [Ancylobacter sp. 6x-1]|uniref:HPP family protein n=1 Tax=Ancylobacter crimeensis TaxID=2579147 RepID=A0ABT0DCM4_9HYPH|nr:HPP family protein [Ancylobacter crimeensis]MCK0197715.1 HPP family protein [Ancylobacter crimeensis]